MSDRVLHLPRLHGEEILWEGRPQDRPFRLRRLGAWLATAVVSGAVLGLIFRNYPLVFATFWGLTLLSLVASAVSESRHGAAVLAHTRYVITNHRVIIVSGAPLTWCCTIALQDLRQVRLVRTVADRLFGTGTLVLEAFYPGRGKRVWVPATGFSLRADRRERPALWGLADVRAVHATLVEALAQARGRDYAHQLTQLTLAS